MDATEQVRRCAVHQQPPPSPPPVGYVREAEPERESGWRLLGVACALWFCVAAWSALIWLVWW